MGDILAEALACQDGLLQASRLSCHVLLCSNSAGLGQDCRQASLQQTMLPCCGAVPGSEKRPDPHLAPFAAQASNIHFIAWLAEQCPLRQHRLHVELRVAAAHGRQHMAGSPTCLLPFVLLHLRPPPPCGLWLTAIRRRNVAASLCCPQAASLSAACKTACCGSQQG